MKLQDFLNNHLRIAGQILYSINIMDITPLRDPPQTTATSLFKTPWSPSGALICCQSVLHYDQTKQRLEVTTCGPPPPIEGIEWTFIENGGGYSRTQSQYIKRFLYIATYSEPICELEIS
jgi:hypothetical protein